MSDWRAHPDRSCRNASLDDLFGPRDVQRTLAEVLCQDCPCLAPCADAARREPYGLYGGVPEGGEGRPWTSDQRGRFDRRAVPA